MIHIHKKVYLSNGDKVTEPGYHFGTYKDGTEYYVGNYKIIFVTKKLTEETDNKKLLEMLNAGVFDFNFDFINKYDTCDYFQKMSNRLNYQIAEEEKQVALNKLKAKLFLEFNLSLELIDRVKNLDIFYDYSDDIRVYNAGHERYTKLQKDLKEVNAEPLLGLYRKLITNSNKS